MKRILMWLAYLIPNLFETAYLKRDKELTDVLSSPVDELYKDDDLFW